MPNHANLPEALARLLAQDMTLSNALAAFAAHLEQANPTVARANEFLVRRLRAAGTGVNAPDIGEILPEFMLTDETGRLRMLDEFLDNGPVVVSIIRGHWCPFCVIEIDALTKAADEIARAGGSAIVIMPERQPYARVVRERGAPFPILSDIDCAYSLQLGLCFYIGDELVRIFNGSGNRLPVFQGNEFWFLPVPATFVVDRRRRVVERMVDPDFRFNRLAIDRIVAAVERAATRGAE